MAMLTEYRNRETHGDAFWLFLIGCFSMTQIRLGAKIGISELFMVVAAPMLFLRNMRLYRQDGMLPILRLLFLWFLGAVLADWYNGANLMQFIRGFSVPVVVWSTVICLHNFLRRDLRNYKWVMIGLAVSTVVSTFVFQRGVAGDLAAEGDLRGAIERTMSYKLFWFIMVQTWVLLPVQVLYMRLPVFWSLVCILISCFMAALCGGRSGFLVGGMSFLLVLWARRDIKAMMSIRKYSIFILCLLSILALSVKYGYEYFGTHGMLNEVESHKFELQTSQGNDVLDFLMRGRGEFFIGLIAALDKPIVGHGSWAVDNKGYILDFMSKHGNEADVKNVMLNWNERGSRFIIPSHSHIVCYWLWHGVFGLVFWGYIIFIAVRTFMYKLHVLPDIFGYWATTLPDFFWSVLFSPFGLRTGESLLFVMMVLVHNVEMRNKGKILNPM